MKRMSKQKALNLKRNSNHKLNLLIPEHIRTIPPYTAGKPIEEVEREFGIHDVIKLASNENPLGTSPLAIQAVMEAASELHRYPDSSGHALIKRISQHLGTYPDNVVLGNGSDEIIGMLTRVLLKPGDEVILPKPAFLMYEISVRIIGAIPVAVPLKIRHTDLKGILEKITSKTRLIFINNPHNPTGNIITKSEFEAFLNQVPGEVAVVVDEAYIEFAKDEKCLNSIAYLDADPCVVILRTFSKAYGLAGLRVGYGIMPSALAELMNRIREPFNVNVLAQAAALAAIDDHAFLQETIDYVHLELDFFYRSLEKIGVTYFPTQTNFLLLDVKIDSQKVFYDLLKEGVIVRSMASYGYPMFIRVNVGRHEENIKFINALERVLGEAKVI
jgi:histidinol-phosphate aminotransferase